MGPRWRQPPRLLFLLLAAALLPGPALCRAVRGVEPRAELMSLAEAATRVPTCALTCLTAAVRDPSCAADLRCTCINSDVATRTTDCVLAACSLPEALVAKNITELVCGRPARDVSARYDILNITLGTFTSLLVAARLVFKRFFGHRHRLSADDWVVFASFLVGIACMVLNSRGLAANGLGRDVWALNTAQLTRFVLFFYVLEVLYIALMSSSKVAMSLFLLAIFPNPEIRRLLNGTSVFVVLFGFSFVLTAVFQCTPVPYFWNQYVDPTSEGRCISTNMLGWVHGGVNIALDVWLLGIPLSQIRRLELHWKKKVGVAIMFLTGAFATVVSILRLQSLVHFASSLNPTWDQWTVAWWSTIETNAGLICLCLPTLRLMLVRLFPRVFSSAGHSSYRPHPGPPRAAAAAAAAADMAANRAAIVVHQQFRVSTSTVEMPMIDAKHLSAKSWAVSAEADPSRTRSLTDPER